MSGAVDPPLAPEEVDDEEAVKVPGAEDTSLLTAGPTGSVHGDEDTVERAGGTEG